LSAALPKLLSSKQRSRRARTNIASVLISCYICIWILTGFVATSDQFLHWFVVPVLFCGILIGMDAVDWFRGRLDIFDPIGILGALGFHLFFLSPLLHVHWDYWMRYVIPPPDWRGWLGGMAFLNLLGLLAYRAFRGGSIGNALKQPRKMMWRLDRQRFFVIMSGALLVTGLLQIWVYARFGGILGYIQAATNLENPDAMRGMGWIFMISESFPILALMAFAVYAGRKESYKSWSVIVFLLLVYFILKMLFGGLRGSRSNTIWGLFWAVGIVHFWLRPISKKLIFVGCISLVLFMYFYGFFKGGGLDALQAFEGAKARIELEERTGRGLEGTLVADLGRSDVQAFLLYRLSRPECDYEYAWGRTYFAAVSILIPRSIVDRPPSKTKEGTEAQYGLGSYIPGVFESSRVYGLTGETMLNFGPIAVPFAFLIFGLVVRGIRRFMMTLEPTDSRLMLLPFLVNLCFVILVGDSDNILFFLIKNGAVPFMVLALSSMRLVVNKSNIWCSTGS
jgi:hypothetical protein